MEQVQIAQDDERNDVWKQLLSLQLPPLKGSTGLCGNNLSVRGSKGEKAGGKMHRKNVRMRYRLN